MQIATLTICILSFMSERKSRDERILVLNRSVCVCVCLCAQSNKRNGLLTSTLYSICCYNNRKNHYGIYSNTAGISNEAFR